MAKNVIICILFIALLIVSGLAYINRGAADKVEVDSLRYALKSEQAKGKELENKISNARDSVELMTTIAMNFKTDTRKAEIEVKEITKKHEHEKANFIVYPTDSVRLLELARFVPSVISR